jgi:hypothetical protein
MARLCWVTISNFGGLYDYSQSFVLSREYVIRFTVDNQYNEVKNADGSKSNTYLW